MAQRDLFRSPPPAWNAKRIIGAKPPFKPKHVWAIRQQLRATGRVRDLALFDCGIDGKLRGCNLVKLRLSDVADHQPEEPGQHRCESGLGVDRDSRGRGQRHFPAYGLR